MTKSPVHGHAALFGVYGMLGIGLMLACLRALISGVEWKNSLFKFSFWACSALCERGANCRRT
jgi:nitric oxide reductase subunit B